MKMNITVEFPEPPVDQDEVTGNILSAISNALDEEHPRLGYSFPSYGWEN